MKNKHILFSTVSCMIIFSFEAKAQCVSTQDCSILGYKSSTCSSGKGLKCPFGNAWYCPCDGSYIYTCTRGNESPSAAKCGDKYSSCNCATGTSWKVDGCKADRASCAIGWIYYADGTCVTPAAHTTSKVALGVVVYVNPDGIGGQVMTARDLGSMAWGGYGTDISSLPNYTSYQTAMKDYDSCSNTDKILKQGSSSTYPAAWAARSYAPTAETSGKWCLPAAGILSSVYVNRSTVNVGIAKLGGTKMPVSSGEDAHMWSSSEYSNYNSWYFCAGNGASQAGLGNSNGSKSSSYSVRPVLEF